MPRINTRLVKSLYKQEKGVDGDEWDDLDLGDESSIGTWTKEETFLLIANIKKQLKKRDSHSYVRRIQLLNWNKVVFPGKNERECKSRLQHLIKKIRHVRTLGEIISDVDIETIDVRKPKSAYALFCEDMKKEDLKGNNFFKEASARFKKLSEEERAAYEVESRAQSKIYKQLCPKGTRRKKTCTTPLMLWFKDQERQGNTDKDKLKRQFAALEDTEKLIWIQMALKANEEDDIEKILTKDEQSILKGEPKQPLNAFNLFIKKKSAEGKIDFKGATEAYRKLSKEEKDVYIEMSRKAKMQYKNDLATYLFSLSPEEQQNYLSKVGTQNPKRTRIVKKVEKPDDEDEIDDDAESEHIEHFNQIEVVEQNEEDYHGLEHDNMHEHIHEHEHDHIVEFENVQIGDIIDMNGYSVEQVDVGSIKMEQSYGEPACNSTSISQPILSNPDCSTTELPTKPSPPLVSTSASKLIDETPREDTTGSKLIDENSESNTRDSENDKESPLSPARKIINLKKRKPEDMEDDASVSSSISKKQKEKSVNKKRRMEENETHDEGPVEIKLEFPEPERIPSTPYTYFIQKIYVGKRKKAKKAYMKLSYAEKKRIIKEHKRRHKEYMIQLEEFCESLSKADLEPFLQRNLLAEKLEEETSDPDGYST